MYMTELSDALRRQALQKSAYRALIWVFVQADDFLEGSVVLQDLRFVDTVHSGDDRAENSQDHLGRVVFPKSRRRTQVPLKKSLEPRSVTKPLDQEHSSEVNELVVPEGNLNFSQAFGHVTENTLTGGTFCPREKIYIIMRQYWHLEQFGLLNSAAKRFMIPDQPPGPS
jgi:hypothetical protein